MFYENYVRLCNAIGTSPSGVAVENGLSRAEVGYWKSGGGVKDATLIKLADYFNVPLSVLKGEATDEDLTRAKIKKGLYRHFKGKHYRVWGEAEHSETGEVMVIYQAMYGAYKVYVRPRDMFTERVERGGYSGPRFAYVGP